ncbi:MAG TPA: GAF domain-containing protein, partial [Thermomicrobiales bacterium]
MLVDGLGAADFAALLDGISDGVTAQGVDDRFVYANAVAARLLGFASAAELLAARPSEVLEHFAVFDEHGEPLPFDRLPGRRVLGNGSDASELLLRFRVLATDEERWATIRAFPLCRHGGDERVAVNLFRDVTDSVVAAHRRDGELRLARLLAGADWSRVAAQIVQVTGESLGWEAGLLWQTDPVRNDLVATDVWHAPDSPLAGFVAARRTRGPAGDPDPIGRARTTVTTVYAPDLTASTVPAGYGDAVAAGVRSVLALPLRAGDEVLGVMEFVDRRRRNPDPDLERLGDLFGLRIGQFAERCRTESAVRTAEARLRLALENASMGTWERHIPTGEVVWSEHVGPLYGLPAGTPGISSEAF